MTDAASYPTWRLPAAQAFAVGQLCEFKFIIKRAAHDGQPFRVEWEELPENRRLQLGAEAPAELRLEMTWGSPRTLAWRRTCAPRPRSPLEARRGHGGSGLGGVVCGGGHGAPVARDGWRREVSQVIGR